jgi:ABC-type antimicrobial peptide transport system permease subunit
MYYLHNTDLGFAFKDRGSVSVYGADVDLTALEDKIRKIPEITETIEGAIPLIPAHTGQKDRIKDWDDKPENAEALNIEYRIISERFLRYYEIKPMEGELPSDNDGYQYVLINESAAKAFGWHNAVGKSFRNSYDVYTVKGVIKNIYNMGPVVDAKPFFYMGKHPNVTSYSMGVLFKCHEDTWKTCRKKIEEIIAAEYPNKYSVITNTEEEYDKYLKSENALRTMLTIVSLVCLIVCIFGFVSMVSLTCVERRKEIAIRKINGATIKDILDIFFKEYLTLLAVGALIAFPVGTIIMKRWLEHYVIQTEMSAWVYLVILLALIMIIVMCVGGRVYKTSRENPVDALNK